ncbi:MAG: LuxR C-terminal-related transcriptional regulator [Paludibacter sp.]|jgi:DNA-binding CsgD family transcriptional regulator
MENNHVMSQQIEPQDELEFLRNILNNIPALVYINELERQNDPSSLKNIYLNQLGLDLIGYTREEIDAMGYRFYEEVIHPEDMEVIPQTYEASNNNYNASKSFVFMQRLKFKGQLKYHWFYDHGTILNTYEDGSPHKALMISVEVSDTMVTHNQLNIALKEISRLKYALKLSTLTLREKEVLHLITKGKTDKCISEKCNISIQTAKKHRNNLINKTGVNNTAELVALAVEAGEY